MLAFGKRVLPACAPTGVGADRNGLAPTGSGKVPDLVFPEEAREASEKPEARIDRSAGRPR